MRRLYIRFKSLVNDSVYSFGRAALLLLVEVWNHTVPVRERCRIRVNKNRRVGIETYAIGKIGFMISIRNAFSKPLSTFLRTYFLHSCVYSVTECRVVGLTV